MTWIKYLENLRGTLVEPYVDREETMVKVGGQSCEPWKGHLGGNLVELWRKVCGTLKELGTNPGRTLGEPLGEPSRAPFSKNRA